MQATIQIERLETPEHAGDWHDKPLRWIVKGPREEAQKFSTAKDASVYARIRRHSATQAEAINSFVSLN
jgi:hypothetical protein